MRMPVKMGNKTRVLVVVVVTGEEMHVTTVSQRQQPSSVRPIVGAWPLFK